MTADDQPTVDQFTEAHADRTVTEIGETYADVQSVAHSGESDAAAIEENN